VLIPARNEEANLLVGLPLILANQWIDFEVIVLDDDSSDATAAVVAEAARWDPRVRLEKAPPLPAGWCGKQHACHVLAGHARGRLLVFLDADVRLAPDALVRISRFMKERGVALASGVPRQELKTFSERLLIPLIHFVLLGYLPMHAMRWTRWPPFAAGCGQLIIADREAYRKCGGHAAIRSSLHDGLTLPRRFREAGLTTDLFDATDLASCRMYQTDAETWRGLGKNAIEGLAAPGRIVPMTFLLVGGHVLPFVLITLPGVAGGTALLCVAAGAAAWLPRFIAAHKFNHSWLSALLHPFSVLALLAIQWQAFIRHVCGIPANWKGRRYPAWSRQELRHPS
jgi:glycosyltransferase involved in cell wall biosynthesis